METKPFRIQAPEDIAKEYGGDKQKIAQAMQMGVIDPTAGVLAGMFIDRIRSAQVQEMVPQPTVAQQVMGGLSSSSPAPPMAPQAGLGALPAPGMEAMMLPAPQAPPVGAPMGMADGGLASLPIPDGMFDEPENGGYGGGGLVAFADGGSADFDRAWAQIKRLEGGLGPRGEMLVSSKGAVGPAQLMPATAPEAARLAGLPWDERRYRTDPAYNEALGRAYYASRVNARGGDFAKAALDYHSGMGSVDRGNIGPAGRKYVRNFIAGFSGDASPAGWERLPAEPSRAAGTSDFRKSFAEKMQLGREVYGALPDAGLNVEEEYYRRELEPEALRKRTKEDMWFTLAQIGAAMAGTKSPNFLQAVGESLAAALPGAAASKKERRAAERDARQGLREVLGLKRAQEEKVIAFATAQQAAEAEAETRRADRELRMQLAQMSEATTRDVAAANLLGQIEIAGMRGTNPSDFDTKFAILKRGNPGLSDAQILNLMKTEGYLGSSQGIIPGMEGVAGGAPGAAGASNMAIVGSRPA